MKKIGDFIGDLFMFIVIWELTILFFIAGYDKEQRRLFHGEKIG